MEYRSRQARLVRSSDAHRYLWGDRESRHVIDWYYVSSDKIHFAVFSLGPGAYWKHSEKYKPVYGADESYYILRGSLTIHNPVTGEVYVIEEGQTMALRKGTWHYGYNFGTIECRIACAFAPVPADLTAADELARLSPPLDTPMGGRYELLGHWPWNSQHEKRRTVVVQDPSQWLHFIEGRETPVRVSLFVSTENLTMGLFPLLPGVSTDPEVHPGDEFAYVASGTAAVFLPDTGEYFEMNSGDGSFIPQGIRHQYFNHSEQPATVIFGVAPTYR